VSEDALQRASDVKVRHEAGLLRKANVLSVGVGYRQRRDLLTDEVVLVVSVSRKMRRDQLHSDDIIPGYIEGIPVDVQETGVLRAM